MTASDILNRSLTLLKRNSPEILTGLGIAGVVSTAYLTAVACFKADKELDEAFGRPRTNGNEEPATLKEQALEVWKLYIPPTVSGVATIACIVGSQKASGRRTAAAVAAYSFTEKAFSEYKDHVVEQIGKGKEQKIRDEIAQKNVSENPPSESKELLILGKGQVLCCELYTGRYFMCDMETLRKAENDLNAMVVNSIHYASLSDFYDLIGLDHTSTSDNLGWDTDKLLELQFSHALSPDGTPCLTFDYNYVRPNDRRLL